MLPPPHLPRLPNKFALDLGFVRKPTWKERLQIAIGYNVKLDIVILIDKRTGAVKESVKFGTTKELVERKLVPANQPIPTSKP